MARHAVEDMMRRITAGVAAPAEGAGSGALRHRYLSHMQTWHGHDFPIEQISVRPAVEWSYAEPGWRRTVAYLTDVEDFSQLGRISPNEGERVAAMVGDGLDLLRSYDEDQTDSVTNLIGCVFVAPVNDLHSISSGRCLGAVAINPTSSWSTLDYASALLHEAVHQALFLHHRSHRIYSRAIPKLADDDALVTSPIRRVRRPYNLAFHAACVLVELLYLYRWADRPIPAAEGSLELLELCLGELEARDDNLTTPGQAVLHELRELSGAFLVAI